MVFAFGKITPNDFHDNDKTNICTNLKLKVHDNTFQ